METDIATLFVRHKVKDAGPWKAAYDESDAKRASMGVTSHGAYQAHDDPNDITVYHRFATVEEAKAFAASPWLKQVMEAAGVVGTPDVWITNEMP